MATASKPPVGFPISSPGVGSEGYFEKLAATIPKLPYQDIDAIAGAILQAIRDERTICVFGNGGSAASASHMMCDLNKGAASLDHRPKVIALTDNIPLLTAWANDRGYEQVFSEQLKTFIRPGDVTFAISGSGSSPNVILALETARKLGAFTVGIAGFDGGKMRALCHLCAVVPCNNMQLIEDLHHAILHSIFTVLSEELHGSRRKAFAITAGRSRT